MTFTLHPLNQSNVKVKILVEAKNQKTLESQGDFTFQAETDLEKPKTNPFIAHL